MSGCKGGAQQLRAGPFQGDHNHFQEQRTMRWAEACVER
jgi:hypothetical protein